MSSPKLAFFLLLLTGNVWSVAHAQKMPPPGGIVGASDTLSLSVLGSEELSKNWRVDTSGHLNLPMIGRVDAAGRPVEQIQAELTTRLRKYFIDPQVVLYIAEYRSRPVTITGAVDKPGVYQLEDRGTLGQVLLLAGGPKDAGPTITVSRASTSAPLDYPGRRVAGSDQMVEVPLEEVLTGHGHAAQLPIIPNDVISVTTIKEPRLVQIAGEVNRPGTIELVSHDAIPLIQALGMAGGVTRSASPKNSVIVRIEKDGTTRSEKVDLRKVLSGKPPTVMLSSGDVVVVPSSALTAFLQAASLSAVTTGMYLIGRF